MPQKFQPVTAKQIVARVKEQLKVDLPLESVLLQQPLSALGEVAIARRLNQRVLPGSGHALTVRVLKKV